MITIALTETCNAFSPMPKRIEDLHELKGQLGAMRDANLDHHEALARTAAKEGAKIIGFGELFTGPYFATVTDEMWLDLAEDVFEGPSAKRLSALAAELSIVIVAPLFELDAKTGRRFNTAIVIDADGRILGRYRKTHIPHGANETEQFLERFYYEAADADLEALFPVFETRYAKVGVGICYDRHFEGVMRSLSAAGAELVFSPAVTFGQKSEYFWQREFEVDAMRNNIFIAGSNRLGSEPPFNVHYFGSSYVTGPNGRADNRTDLPNLVLADIDLSTLSGADPSGWSLGKDRRTGDYTP